MVIYLPGDTAANRSPKPPPSFDELTPREIVVELDKYIVGQNAAKRAVAIALAQSRAPAEASARAGGGSSAKKYSDDRAHGRGKNGNRAPAGAAWPGALS